MRQTRPQSPLALPLRALMPSFQARFPRVVQWTPRKCGAAALLGKPGFDRRELVAAIAPEADMGKTARSRRLAHPRLGNGEQLRDLTRGQQPLAHLTTSFPHTLQPGRSERAKSSSLFAFG